MDTQADSIRVLHVDDEPDFASVAAEFLERADERFTVETATGPADALEPVRAGTLDCIVSDYDMPTSTGIEFLEAVRELEPELPFILFTGKGSEEVASDAISAGVTDYLQKGAGTDKYAVLANRIGNAVEARQTHRESEHRRHRLEQVLKTVPACVVQLDYDGEFVFANERAEEVLGLDPAAVTDRTYNDPRWEITDLDGTPIPDEQLPFRRVRETGEPVYGVRHTVTWPDGTRKVLLVNGAPLFDANGAVQSAVFALSDITGQRELERDQSLYEAAFTNAFDAIVIADDAGEIIEANESAAELFGCRRESLRGRSLAEFAPQDADFEASWAAFQQASTNRGELPLSRPDGTELRIEYAATRDIVPGYHVAIIRQVGETRTNSNLIHGE